MAGDSINATLDAKTFAALADLAYQESGLQLVAEKTSMIQSRLRHRLRALGIDDFGKYVSLVCSENGATERRQMISALTTNVSHFFREPHHFDILVKDALPPLLENARKGGKVRIWSAGCSNGQEAYSVAISILEHFPDLANLDFKILATDIDPNVVLFGQKGQYPERLVSGVSKDLLLKYFKKEVANNEISFQISPIVKSMVAFKELNLLAEWPMRHEMNAIFCRNVVIYFDLQTQNKLWPRFRNHLSSEGYLFLGHSERIAEPDTSGFQNDGPTTYRPTTTSLI